MGDKRNKRVISGLKITRHIVMSHLCFLDDLLFSGAKELGEWLHIYRIITSFGEAYGLLMRKKSLLWSMVIGRIQKSNKFVAYLISHAKILILVLCTLFSDLNQTSMVAKIGNG